MIQRLAQFVNRRFYAVKQSIHDFIALHRLSSTQSALVKCVIARKLTYLTVQKAANLVHLCQKIEEDDIPGMFVEAGCALGGSSILIGSNKSLARKFNIYDVFDMIPAPGEKDPRDAHQRYDVIRTGGSEGIDGDLYYGYETDVRKIVNRNLTEFGIDPDKASISFVKGFVQDTLVVDEAVAFAHVDVDWYEPVKICIERIFPKLSIGGVIVFDDYHDWGGAKKAIDEYLQKAPGQHTVNDTYGHMVVQRVA
uniref:Macrocin-O-methyltransferase n=1 Tax=Magnetococcus massalia (strain MO-1) TaxID=451514 RepID=A0A1S7LK18_MAGMO|nr:Conserved protein of unknown function [Candidatus Magnetococcus massalia]